MPRRDGALLTRPLSIARELCIIIILCSVRFDRLRLVKNVQKRVFLEFPARFERILRKVARLVGAARGSSIFPL